MNKQASKILHLTAAAIVAAAGLFWNGEVPLGAGSSLISEAHARIGRPLTPMSYAGVARRTTIVAPIIVAPVIVPRVVVAPVVVGPACAQVRNAYGQIVTVCR